MFHREINYFPWPFLDSYVNLAEGKPYENMIKKMAPVRDGSTNSWKVSAEPLCWY